VSTVCWCLLRRPGGDVSVAGTGRGRSLRRLTVLLGRSALAHRRRIVSSRQRTRRTRSTPIAALDLLAPLDHPGHARPCLPGRGHRDRTRHRTHPSRSDRIDRQRISASLRRTALGHPPHRRNPAGLVTMAKTTPIPSTPFPLPTPRTPMIPIYGCSIRPGAIAVLAQHFPLTWVGPCGAARLGFDLHRADGGYQVF
jgi:hypothetical protein